MRPAWSETVRDDASEPEDEKPSVAFALDFLEKADEMEDEALLAAREEEVKVPGRSVTRWVEPLTVPVMKTPAASVCPRQLGLEAEREGKGRGVRAPVSELSPWRHRSGVQTAGRVALVVARPAASG